jgi:transcriptional regulator with XRE-family HTH domain
MDQGAPDSRTHRATPPTLVRRLSATTANPWINRPIRGSNHDVAMPGRDSPLARGERRSRLLRQRIADELNRTRRMSGLSIRETARRAGSSRDNIIRLERGDPTSMTLDLVARVAPVVGLELAAALHQDGDPVRDRAHLALLHRFRSRLPPGARWRTEVPMPIAGDLRSGDAVVDVAEGELLVEAETYLGDIQAMERKLAAKARDLGVDRTALLVADTRHNRAVIRDHPELARRFPVGTRAFAAALRAGRLPRGDGLVIL